ncbi:hypothetical protein [Actinoplanes sp. NPDC089786]|uniref:hypothetical protein n=1 Tax=Actinoplanes sp. NPDC089786 TaxID=3155185 RepID=UPI00343FF72D
MNQQLFDELTADAPPSTVDVPGIIRRERRRRGLLRVGAPAAAALTVLSAIAVLAPGDPPPAPSVVAQPSSTTTPGPAGFRLVAHDRASAAATAETLRAALDDAVRRTAPGATWLTQGLTKEATPDGRPPRIFGDDQRRPSSQMFTGTTGIALDGRRGTLSLEVISTDPCTGGSLAKCPPTGTDPLTGLFACGPAAKTCTTGTGEDGRRRRVQTMESLGGFLSQETNVELADGRVLMVAVTNQFIKPGSGVTNDYVAQPATPLSPAAVTGIATTIGDRILA